MSLESQLQTKFLLKAPERFPDLRLFRRNIITVNVEGRGIRAGIKGQCDLYGYFRGGRVIEIELKGPTRPMTPEQLNWQAWCNEWKIPHLVLRAKRNETVDETVERWLSELAASLLAAAG